MQSLSKYNKGITYLLCAIDLFSKYAWDIPIKDNKGVSIADAFQKILKESNRKPNKKWADKGSEFYKNSFKKWVKDDIEMYSIHNEGKSVIAERFIRTLKNKIFKHMTAISKNVYFDVFDDIVNKYNDIEQLKCNLLMLKIIHMLIQRKKLMIKIQNLKLGIT